MCPLYKTKGWKENIDYTKMVLLMENQIFLAFLDENNSIVFCFFDLSSQILHWKLSSYKLFVSEKDTIFLIKFAQELKKKIFEIFYSYKTYLV